MRQPCAIESDSVQSIRPLARRNEIASRFNDLSSKTLGSYNRWRDLGKQRLESRNVIRVQVRYEHEIDFFQTHTQL